MSRYRHIIAQKPLRLASKAASVGRKSARTWARYDGISYRVAACAEHRGEV